ncbi:MAG TPA: hypothetical protein VFI45_07545 [Candidatus Acidoferrum sp.]|nr:hypothetical protein [Candidatus Acidoferrum sp.]
MPDGNLSDVLKARPRGDVLAVVLFSLAAAMALILFLIEKTSATVGISLFFIFGFLVYPTLRVLAQKRNLQTIALIVLLLLTCAFGWYVWPKTKAESSASTGGLERVDRVIAGAFVDEATRNGIRGAYVSVVNRPEVGSSDSNGNFRLELDSTKPFPDVVKIRVGASGYSVIEDDVRPPVHDLIVQLRRTTK